MGTIYIYTAWLVDATGSLAAGATGPLAVDGDWGAKMLDSRTQQYLDVTTRHKTRRTYHHCGHTMQYIRKKECTPCNYTARWVGAPDPVRRAGHISYRDLCGAGSSGARTTLYLPELPGVSGLLPARGGWPAEPGARCCVLDCCPPGCWPLCPRCCAED